MVAVGVSLLMAGCGDPAENARRRIQSNNIAFTVDDFVAMAGRGDVENVKLFIEGGMDINAQEITGYTALMLASEQGNIEVVQTLITGGANLNAQGADGVTALILAAFHNRLEVVRALLDAGADVRPTDEKGWTAFMKAVYRGHERIVEAMLPSNKDQAAKAMNLAVIMGHNRVIEKLLVGGVSPDLQLDKGQTVLIRAASRGNEQIVRQLLEAGAQPLAADSEGRTAAVVAASAGHRNIARLLQDAESGRPLPSPTPPVAPVVAAIEPVPPTETPSPTPVEVAVASPTPVPEPSPAIISGPTPVEIVSSTPAPTPESTPHLIPSPSPVATPAVAPVVAASDPLSAIPSDPTPAPAAPELTALNPTTAEPGVASDETPFAGDFATLAPSTNPTPPAIRMLEFNESVVPVMLTGVSADIGEFQVTSGDGVQTSYARVGDKIPGTSFVVKRLRALRQVDKDGSPADVSEARVQEASTGREHRLIKDLPARGAKNSAVIAVEGHADRITVRPGEEFFLPSDPTNLYKVVDVRRDAVVLQIVETGENVTIRR